MKTVISIPDPIFEEANLLATRLNISPSELYVTAIQEFLKRHRYDMVTEKLNAIYSKESSKMDPVTQALQWKSLPKDSCHTKSAGCSRA